MREWLSWYGGRASTSARPSGVSSRRAVAAPPGTLPSTQVLDGTGLVDPSFDRFGWLWSGQAADPSRLIAVDGAGAIVGIDARWLAGRQLVGVSLSRDGGRLLVVSQSGSQTVVEVAAVSRSDAGEPLGVGEPLAIGADVGQVTDAIWVDDVTVGLLGAPADDDPVPLWLVAVGGRTTADVTVPDAVGISARHGDRSITVVSADGAVRERAGTGWAGVATGVQELAFEG